jgi:hypothetical protein
MANQYRLQQAPQATNDGSGMVAFDIYGVTSEGNAIPGRHQTVLISQVDIDTWDALPESTGPQQQAKNQAMKTLISAALPAGWDDSDLQDVVDENTEANTAAAAVDDYITNTLSISYPVDFSL